MSCFPDKFPVLKQDSIVKVCLDEIDTDWGLLVLLMTPASCLVFSLMEI